MQINVRATKRSDLNFDFANIQPVPIFLSYAYAELPLKIPLRKMYKMIAKKTITYRLVALFNSKLSVGLSPAWSKATPPLLVVPSFQVEQQALCFGSVALLLDFSTSQSA
jgi:hypothetical protein